MLEATEFPYVYCTSLDMTQGTDPAEFLSAPFSNAHLLGMPSGLDICSSAVM
jgi:hypothetical protein